MQAHAETTLHPFKVSVSAVGDFDSSFIGTVITFAIDPAKARAQALNDLWDSRLDAASCSASFETEQLPDFLVCESFIIDLDGEERNTRFVFNLVERKIVAAHLFNNGEWADDDRALDILDELINDPASCILRDPEAFGIESSEELPAWIRIV